MAAYLMLPAIMFWTGIMVILLSVALVRALIRYKKDRRRPFPALAVAPVLPISGLGVFQCIVYRDFQYQLHYDILQYTVDLGSASGLPEEVVLPASYNVQFTGLVKVARGNVTLKSVNTLYGPGF